MGRWEYILTQVTVADLQILFAAAIVGVGITLFLARGTSRPWESGQVHNALLAEHVLSLIELVPENPFAKSLKNAIVAVYRVSGFPNLSEESVAESFNNLDRIEQLSLLAMAFNELGHSPLLPNASWIPVKTPFSGGFDETVVESMSESLTQKFRVRICLGNGRFAITEWGIEDMLPPKSESKDHTDDASLTSPKRRSFGPYTLESSFVREYQLQDHTAEFIDDPAIDGPIKYLFALVVTRNSDGQIEFIVGAEKPFRLPGISELIDSDEALKEYFGGASELDDNSSKSIVLGVLSSEGHVNYGSSPKWADPQLFIVKALKIARQRLGIDH